MTPEEHVRRLERVRRWRARQQAQMTDEQRESLRAYQRIRQRQRRAQMTDEQREAARTYMREYTRRRRANYTPAERAQERAVKRRWWHGLDYWRKAAVLKQHRAWYAGLPPARRAELLKRRAERRRRANKKGAAGQVG